MNGPTLQWHSSTHTQLSLRSSTIDRLIFSDFYTTFALNDSTIDSVTRAPPRCDEAHHTWPLRRLIEITTALLHHPRHATPAAFQLTRTCQKVIDTRAISISNIPLSRPRSAKGARDIFSGLPFRIVHIQESVNRIFVPDYSIDGLPSFVFLDAKHAVHVSPSCGALSREKKDVLQLIAFDHDHLVFYAPTIFHSGRKCQRNLRATKWF